MWGKLVVMVLKVNWSEFALHFERQKDSLELVIVVTLEILLLWEI